ncbi:MAG: hypothetical protein K9M07_02530 [Simkaniaceae bacterium]|nr:hypothetical protein [Simkaniaceae bacterium]
MASTNNSLTHTMEWSTVQDRLNRIHREAPLYEDTYRLTQIALQTLSIAGFIGSTALFCSPIGIPAFIGMEAMTVVVLSAAYLIPAAIAVLAQMEYRNLPNMELVKLERDSFPDWMSRNGYEAQLLQHDALGISDEVLGVRGKDECGIGRALRDKAKAAACYIDNFLKASHSSRQINRNYQWGRGVAVTVYSIAWLYSTLVVSEAKRRRDEGIKKREEEAKKNKESGLKRTWGDAAADTARRVVDETRLATTQWVAQERMLKASQSFDRTMGYLTTQMSQKESELNGFFRRAYDAYQNEIREVSADEASLAGFRETASPVSRTGGYDLPETGFIQYWEDPSPVGRSPTESAASGAGDPL